MLRLRLILVLLLVTCFSIAVYLQPEYALRQQASGQSQGFLALALGDGRKLFANEVFAKADAYFHRGNYPSIFDSARKEENHMTEAASEDHGDETGHGDSHDGHEHETEGPSAHDWIERFGENFRASKHVHLEKGSEREMLPWLRLSAELDPHNVDSYIVSSYWLRKRLNKVDEAEQFLREGLKDNPNDPEILNELAWLLFENRKDMVRSGNLWRVALRRWHAVEDPKEEPDKPLLRAILTGLYELAIAQQQTDTAVGYLKQMKEISPNPEKLQQRIDDLLQGKPPVLRP